MEQKNLRNFVTSLPDSAAVPAAEGLLDLTSVAGPAPDDAGLGGDNVPCLIELVKALQPNTNELPSSIKETLTGLTGLRRLAAAITIQLTDYGGTNPGATYDEMTEIAPDLCAEFQKEFVVALCKVIQESEIPEQSVYCQRLFDFFNHQYFEGRLPDYRVRVVYDVWFWEIYRCGNTPVFPPNCDASGFTDFRGKQMFIRFLALAWSGGVTMPGLLLYEMAYAAYAATGGEDTGWWQSEMARLKGLGAPVDGSDA